MGGNAVLRDREWGASWHHRIIFFFIFFQVSSGDPGLHNEPKVCVCWGEGITTEQIELSMEAFSFD